MPNPRADYIAQHGRTVRRRSRALVWLENYAEFRDDLELRALLQRALDAADNEVQQR